MGWGNGWGGGGGIFYALLPLGCLPWTILLLLWGLPQTAVLTVFRGSATARAILLPLEGLPWTILATSSRSAMDNFSYLQNVCHDSFTQLLSSLPPFPICFEAENPSIIKDFCSARTGSLKHLNCIVFCIYWKIRLS